MVELSKIIFLISNTIPKRRIPSERVTRSVLSLLLRKMETTIVYWGYIGIMEKKMEATIVYWGYNGIMEKRMEATVVYWGYNGIMENKMETTIVYWGYITPIMENKMEKKMDNEMRTGGIWGFKGL